MATTGEIIKEKREKLGMTQVDLANKLNVNKSAVNMMEHDKLSISPKRIIELSYILYCEPTELIGDIPAVSGSVVELELVAKQLDDERIGMLIKYAKFLAKEKKEKENK